MPSNKTWSSFVICEIQASVLDCECLAAFLHPNELYFIETLTGITQKMEMIHLTVKAH